MKRIVRTLSALTAVLPLALGGVALIALPACDGGGAEEVGEDLDEAVEEAGDAVEDATDGK
jgi:hypothetical protein